MFSRNNMVHILSNLFLWCTILTKKHLPDIIHYDSISEYSEFSEFSEYSECSEYSEF